MPVGIEVGLQHRGGERLADAVLHDPRSSSARPTRPSSRRCASSSTCSSPRSRSHQSAPITRAVSSPRSAPAVGRVVVPPIRGGDGRVLPRRDPESVEVPLALEDGAVDRRATGRAPGSRRDPPRSCPAGRPVGVPILPPGSSSAREFTQPLCPSRFGREGRSGTIESSRSFVGVPPGNRSIDQPPPRIHSRSGCSSA